ncbi:hypothetical protein A2U01_0091013, partial [Trifolium medium]|nr:hypothetical protein [Trifolium medium]
GFRQADYCWASQQRFSAHTDEEYAEMLQTLALPGRDWHYNRDRDHYVSLPCHLCYHERGAYTGGRDDCAEY